MRHKVIGLPIWARARAPRSFATLQIYRPPIRWIANNAHASDKQSSPLRILFCGSDDFSMASLKALHEESQLPHSNIISIDVVTRKDKYTGRGNKTLRSPPIKQAATELGLPLHQIDTFRGWNLPVYDSSFNPEINLIIAVSFGLLIPMRIINSAKYGGLNVHPSMLPDLRGAAPIEWTIIRGLSNTGVSIQTLHPTKFDEGVVLDQTPAPGLKIPDNDTISPEELKAMLAPIGARMLVSAIRNGLYVPPYEAISQTVRKSESTLAPKITMKACAVDFETMSRDKILRLNRGLGPRFSLVAAAKPNQDETELVIKFSKLLRIPTSHDIPLDIQDEVLSIPIGVPYTFITRDQDIGNCNNPLFVNVISETYDRPSQLAIPYITIPSKAPAPAASAASRANLFDVPVRIGPYLLFEFSHPLSQVNPEEPKTST